MCTDKPKSKSLSFVPSFDFFLPVSSYYTSVIFDSNVCSQSATLFMVIINLINVYVWLATHAAFLQIRMLISLDQNTLYGATGGVGGGVLSCTNLTAHDVINDVPCAIKPGWIYLLQNLVGERGGRGRGTGWEAGWCVIKVIKHVLPIKDKQNLQ